MRLRKKSVLWTWTCSYIVIFLIFLTMVFINYQRSVVALKEEIISANELTFHNAADAIDTYMKQMQENYAYTLLNKNTATLQGHKKMDGQFYQLTSQLQEELYQYCIGQDNIFPIIYFNDIDYMVTGMNSCSSTLYFRGLPNQADPEMDYNAWKDVLTGDYRGDYMVAKGLNWWTKEPCLVYANTVRRTPRGAHNIFVSIPMTRIEEATRYMMRDAWLLVRLNDEETVAISNGKVTQPPAWVEKEKYFIRMEKESAESNVAYELVFTEQSVEDAFRGVRTNFWMNLTLTIMLAVGCMIALLRFNYRPIRSVIAEIGEGDDGAEGNEFERLKGTFVRLNKEKQTTQRLVEQQKKELSSSRLLMLMKGRGSKLAESADTELLESLPKGRVALLGFFIPIHPDTKEKEVDLYFFVLDNIFSELMEGENIFRVEDGGFVYYICDLGERSPEEWRVLTMERMDYLCKIIYDNWKLPVVAVMGENGEDISVLKYLYQNVKSAFEYGELVGGSGVIDVKLLPQYDEFHLLRQHLDQRFRQLFEENDKELLQDTLEQLFAEEDAANKSLAVAKMRVYEAFGVAMDVFREFVNGVSARETAFSYMEGLVRARSIFEMRDEFEELLKFQMQAVFRNHAGEGKGIVSKVIRYVQEHYNDSNLNLNYIADGLGKNSRYVSRAFTEQTGVSILYYINEVRVEKARELMMTRTYTLQEVAQMVGYPNMRAFRNAFEKVKGESPENFSN